MKGRVTSGLMAILVLLYFRVSKSEQPEGYLGCYGDYGEQYLTGQYSQVLKYFEYNNGSACKHFCESERIRYAATQWRYCICVRTLVNAEKSTSCSVPCPGNINEICGSASDVSVYDTMFKLTEPKTVFTETIISTNGMTDEPVRSNPAEEANTNISAKVKSEWDFTEPTATGSVLNLEQTEGTNKRTLTTVYITIPVVGLVSGSIALTVFIILRRRRLEDATSDCGNTSNQGSARTVNPDLTLGNMAGENGRSNPDNYAATSNHSQYCALMFEDNNTLSDREYTSIETTFLDQSEDSHNYEELETQLGQGEKKLRLC